jgi:uncharacterized protein (DUF488 family)
MAAEAPPLFTIGHSNRSLEDFVALLQASEVRLLVDTRTAPRSRHNPQFDRDALEVSLAEHGIDYVHQPALGGLRRARPDSPNSGWRNTSFRAYADHMQTPEFAEAVRDIIDRSATVTTAVMCAEAVPWRCHRWLLADALTVRNVPVRHIMATGTTRPHNLTSWARLDGTDILYPPTPEPGGESEEPKRLDES